MVGLLSWCLYRRDRDRDHDPSIMFTLKQIGVVALILYSIQFVVVRVTTVPSSSNKEIPLAHRSSSNSNDNGDATAKPALFFHEANRTFRILQLTDLHLGEDPFTDWARQADRNTHTLIRNLIRWEHPDLIVLTGDQLTGNNVNTNATDYYNALADTIEEFHIPYCLIFGNHDDAPYKMTYPNGTVDVHPARTSRSTLLRTDRAHTYSLSQMGPTTVAGVSNYILSVYDANAINNNNNNSNNNDVRLQIVLLDSGGGSDRPDPGISETQLDWYLSHRLPDVDAVAFQHIPAEAFRYRNSNTTTTTTTTTTSGSPECRGFDGDHGIAPLVDDPRNETLFLATRDVRLQFLAVGHNHGNSYCCRSTAVRGAATETAARRSDLRLCFGRHSGYGGYGNVERGGRVYDITLLDNGSVAWKSWVRLESKNKADFYHESD